MRLWLEKWINKFKYAFQGLFHGICKDASIRLQACIGILVIVICSFLHLSIIRWIIVLSLILLVLCSEFINSCIEHLVDVLFPYQDPKAKVIKDYAAASVLLISMLAALVGLYVIGTSIL